MRRVQQRGAGGGPKAKGGRGPAARHAPKFTEEDLELSNSGSEGDDPFASKANKVNLRMSDDAEDDDDDHVQGVMDLEDDEDEDEDDDDDEDEDFDDDDEEGLLQYALKRGGKTAEMAKAAKALGQKLKLQKGESSSEDEDEDDEDDQRAGAAKKKQKKGAEAAADRLWGASKRAYYDDDAAEAGDDDEVAKEEEREALRLQKERASRLAAADYGLDEDGEDEDEGDEDEDEDEDEAEETLEVATKKGAAAAPKGKGKAVAGSGGGRGGVEMVPVAREPGAAGSDALMGALLADAPELLGLLQELTDSLNEVRTRVGPVLDEVRAGGLATREGLSYLEAKHLLLLSYVMHITFYLLLKAEGRPVRDHPVIARMVELRAYLEKIRPIDKQLAYQVDKLVKAASRAADTEAATPKAGRAAQQVAEDDLAGPGPSSAALDDDAARYGPRPDALVAKATAFGGMAAAAAGAAPTDGIYRPPKINPVSMELDEAKAAGGAALTSQDRRRLNDLKSKAQRSDTLRALAAELAGAPDEERAAVAGFDSVGALKMRQRLEARAAVEEDLFARVPLSKDEAKRLKMQRREGLSGAGMLEDFGDEVADLVDMASGGAAGGEGSRGASLNDLFAKQKVSQRFGADHPSLSQRMHGGDQDLPLREPLQDRRAKFDGAAAKRAAAQRGAGSDDYDGGAPDEEYDASMGAGGKRAAAGDEDDVYRGAKEAAAARKKARADAHRAPALAPPLPDPKADAARSITTEIQRNRGLTPHRRRDQKNPRKANRMKFEKAMVRVKGAVQSVRAPEAVAYGGEATGIKAKVAKSRRLG